MSKDRYGLIIFLILAVAGFYITLYLTYVNPVLGDVFFILFVFGIAIPISIGILVLGGILIIALCFIGWMMRRKNLRKPSGKVATSRRRKT